MNQIRNVCLAASTICLMMWACTPEKPQKATVRIISTTQANSSVTVSLIRNLDKITLATSTTDSAGHSAFEIDVAEPTIALIQIGKKYGEVYLAPGYNLVIKENGADYQSPLTFSGKGAGANNYISWVNSNVERIKWARGKGLYHLDLEDFRKRFDSLKTTIQDFHNGYIDSVALPAELVTTLEYKNNIKFSSVQQEFKFYKLNALLVEQWQAQKNGQNYLADNVPQELTALAAEPPFDTLLMKGASADHEQLLNYYWHSNVYLPVTRQFMGSELSEHHSIPLLSDARIKKAGSPKALREGLLAFNIKYWLGIFGITPETDSIFSDFKKAHPRSRYVPSVQKTYNEFIALSPGKPAPHFEGRTPQGVSMSIQQLRGKIVYIDVWATWCRPCVAEIPSAIKLQQKFADEKGIEFLNVSVDLDRSAWETFLARNTNWKGTHVIVDEDQRGALYADYKFAGVPAYILIDRAGNILELKASRPSDERLESKIRAALAAGV